MEVPCPRPDVRNRYGEQGFTRGRVILAIVTLMIALAIAAVVQFELRSFADDAAVRSDLLTLGRKLTIQGTQDPNVYCTDGDFALPVPIDATCLNHTNVFNAFRRVAYTSSGPAVIYWLASSGSGLAPRLAARSSTGHAFEYEDGTVHQIDVASFSDDVNGVGDSTNGFIFSAGANGAKSRFSTEQGSTGDGSGLWSARTGLWTAAVAAGSPS